MKIKFSKIAALLLTGVVCLAPGCTDYQSDINDIYSRIEKLAEKETVSSLADQVNGINATVQGLVSGQKSLEDQLKDLKSAVADLKTRCDGFDQSIKAINTDLSDIKTRLGKAETNIENLQKDLNKLNTTVSDLSSAFNDFKNSTTNKLAELAGEDKRLQTEIDGIDKQITTINGQISKLNDDLAKEIRDRKDADNLLDGQIKDEIKNRELAISGVNNKIDLLEKDLRKALSDSCLSVLKAAEKKINDAVGAEKLARENADQLINNALASEISNRQNADKALQDAIDAEANARKAQDNTLKSLIEAEEGARKVADSLIYVYLKDNYMDAEAVKAAIAAEAVARHYEDSVLNVRINTVANNLTNLANQVTLYKGEIDGKIGALEQRATEAEDAIKAIKEKDIPALKNVQDSLALVCKALDGKISSEATARQNGDKFLQDSIDATNRTIKAMQKAIKDYVIAQAVVDKNQSDSLEAAFEKFNDYVLTTTFNTYKTEVAEALDAKADTATVNQAIRQFTKDIADLQTALGNEVIARENGDKACLDSIGKVALRVVALEKYADKLENEIIPELKAVDAALKASIDSLCPIVADLEARMLTAEANIKNVQDSLANAYVRLDNLDNEVINLKTRMDKAEADIENLMARIQSIEFVPDCADCFATINYVFSPDSVLFKSAPSFITYKVYPANLADSLADAVNAMVTADGPLNAFFDVVPVKDRDNTVITFGEQEEDATSLATELEILGAEVSDRTNGAVKFTVKGVNADAFYLYWVLASLKDNMREAFIEELMDSFYDMDFDPDGLAVGNTLRKALNLALEFIRKGEINLGSAPSIDVPVFGEPVLRSNSLSYNPIPTPTGYSREYIIDRDSVSNFLAQIRETEFGQQTPARGILEYAANLVELLNQGYRYASCFVLESNANGNVMTSEYNVWAGNVTTVFLDGFKRLTPEGDPNAEWEYFEVDIHETPYTNQDTHILCDSIAPFVRVSQQGGKSVSIPVNEAEELLGVDLGISYTCASSIYDVDTWDPCTDESVLEAYTMFPGTENPYQFDEWTLDNLKKEKLNTPDKAKKAIGSFEYVTYIATTPGFPVFSRYADVWLFVTKEKASVAINADPIYWTYKKDVATDAEIFNGNTTAKYSRLDENKIGIPMASIDMTDLQRIGVSVEDFDPSNPVLDSARVRSHNPETGELGEWGTVGDTKLWSMDFNEAHDTLFVAIDSLLWDKDYEFYYTVDLDMAEIKLKGSFQTIDRWRDTVKIAYNDASVTYHKDITAGVIYTVCFDQNGVYQGLPHTACMNALGVTDVDDIAVPQAIKHNNISNGVYTYIDAASPAVRKPANYAEELTRAEFGIDNLSEHSLCDDAADYTKVESFAKYADFFHTIGTDLAYGKDTTLRDTTHTYYGQVIVLEGKFHYDAPKYDFRHITWYVFDPVTAAEGYAVKDTLGVPTGSVAPFFTKVEPDYGGQAAKWQLEHFGVKSVNLPEAFKIVNENMETPDTTGTGLEVSFRFRDVTENNVTAPFVPYCNREDEWYLRASTNITISEDGKYLLDYHGWDEQVPVYGELGIRNSDGSLWKFPTSFDEGFECIYADKITDASQDLTVGRYANYQVVKFNPLHDFTASAAPTMKVTNAGTYSIVLFDNLSLLDQRYLDPDDTYSVTFYEGYTKTDGSKGTQMFNGGTWAQGLDFGFAEGVTSQEAYDITDNFDFDDQFEDLAAARYLEDIEGKFAIVEEEGVHNLYFYYDGQLTLTEPITFGINASLIWDWIRVPEKAVVPVKVEKTGASSGEGN